MHGGAKGALALALHRPDDSHCWRRVATGPATL